MKTLAFRIVVLCIECAAVEAATGGVSLPAPPLTGHISDVFCIEKTLAILFQLQNATDDDIWCFQDPPGVETTVKQSGCEVYVSAKNVEVPGDVGLFLPSTRYVRIAPHSSKEFLLALKLPVKERTFFSQIHRSKSVSHRSLDLGALRQIELLFGYVVGPLDDRATRNPFSLQQNPNPDECELNSNWVSKRGENVLYMAKTFEMGFDLRSARELPVHGKEDILKLSRQDVPYDVLLFPTDK